MCNNTIALITRGILCCGELVQRFVTPLSLSLEFNNFILQHLRIDPFIINLKIFDQELYLKSKDFKINIKEPTNFQILNITC